MNHLMELTKRASNLARQNRHYVFKTCKRRSGDSTSYKPYKVFTMSKLYCAANVARILLAAFSSVTNRSTTPGCARTC